MFVQTIYFSDYWIKARGEFNEKVAAYIDEQIKIVASKKTQGLGP